MITKFQTPAGTLDKIEINDNVPIIKEEQYYEPIINKPEWDFKDYANNMSEIKNALNRRGVTSYGQNFKQSQPGKINPGMFLANWNSHRGDLTYENMIQTRKPNRFPSKNAANQSVIQNTARALDWHPNPKNDHTQQLGEAVQYQGVTPAVEALAKQLGISQSDAINKYKEIMQFRYNSNINPRERNMSNEKINSTIETYDTNGVFDGMTDDQKNFIFNSLAYNGKQEYDGTAYAKQGKKLISRRKKGKLC